MRCSSDSCVRPPFGYFAEFSDRDALVHDAGPGAVRRRGAAGDASRRFFSTSHLSEAPQHSGVARSFRRSLGGVASGEPPGRSRSSVETPERDLQIFGAVSAHPSHALSASLDPAFCMNRKDRTIPLPGCLRTSFGLLRMLSNYWWNASREPGHHAAHAPRRPICMVSPATPFPRCAMGSSDIAATSVTQFRNRLCRWNRQNPPRRCQCQTALAILPTGIFAQQSGKVGTYRSGLSGGRDGASDRFGSGFAQSNLNAASGTRAGSGPMTERSGCGRRFGDRCGPAGTAKECRPAEQRRRRASLSGHSAARDAVARREVSAARRSTPHSSCHTGRPAWSRFPNNTCSGIPVHRPGRRERRNRGANSTCQPMSLPTAAPATGPALKSVNAESAPFRRPHSRR